MSKGELVTDKYIFFYGGIYSQWYPCKFKVDDIEYNCAEQYMMSNKAFLFNDFEILEKIMETNNPKKQKELGKQVKNFDRDFWNNHAAKEIVYVGNYHKFTQNRKLKKELLLTGNRKFVEASPFDKIWGIGLGVDNPDCLDESKWRGTNWLGKVLTQVRDDIKNG